MGAFMTGLIGGTATGLTEGLKTHMKRQGDAFDSGLKAALENTERRRIKHDKDREEAETALEVMSSLTGGDLSKAELLIKKTGGVSMTQDFVTNFLKASRVDPNITIDKVAPFLAQHEGSLTSEQALNAMVGKFSATLPAEQEKTLFGDPRNMRKQLSERYKAMGIPVADAGSVQAKRAATPGAINQSLLRTPDEMTALRKSKAEVEGLEDANRARKIAIDTSLKEYGYLDRREQDRIANISAQIADTQASTQVRLQALKTAREFDAPKARAAIDASVASSIASRSSKDMAEQYNILGAEERHYNDQLSQQKEDSNEYYRTARRLTDIRLARGKLLAKGLTTPGDDTFSNVNVVSAANAIKADAVRDAGLKYKLDVHGRIQILKGGTSDKVYQASRNAYTNFRKSFGQSNAPQVRQQLAAMQQSMYNAQSTYVSNKVNKHFKNVDTKSATHDTIPKSHKLSDGTLDIGKLRSLKPGTLVLINSQKALKENWEEYGEAGNFAVWDGSALIQRKRNPNEQQMPTYNLKQTTFSR
jgi:hypothetical protein